MSEISVTFSKRSLDDLIKSFENVPDEIRKKAVRKSVREATKVLTSAVKAAAPVQSGTLKRNISARHRTYSRGRLFYSLVGAKYLEQKNNPGVYIHILETGGQKFQRGQNPFAKAAFERVSPRAKIALISTLKSEFKNIRGKR